ncbi:unnamed protein product [Alopecurus aequalis]
MSSCSLEVTDLTLHVLETITSQFSDEHKVGSGGYGEVYRAEYNGYEIAVKKLHVMHGLDDKEFTNEFRQLMKVRHENIIRLIAYCYEIKHKHTEINGQLILAKVIDRALCFEYMHQGSLASHISDDSSVHDWATTYKIIRGTCEGLHYLHKGRGERDCICHLDLKPDNILLDKDMTPKIADFGLSRLFGKSKTYETCSGVKGTVGFMPPEYILNGAMSPKNDVFSLGVIIFYLVAGRIGYGDYCDSKYSRQEFIERVQEYWKKKMHAAVPYYIWEEINLLGVKICIELAMSCVVKERAKRPSTEAIIDVLQKLDAQIEKITKKDSNSLSGQSLPTPTKSGPRGGSGGDARDIKEKPWRLRSLTICYGGSINGFSFSYIDQCRKRQHIGPWGTQYNNCKTETIFFDPSEFVEEVAGVFGSRLEYTLVISLTFITNLRSYGPFGNYYHKEWTTTDFRFMADEGSSIMGFHGRSGTRLDSLGVYMYPNNNTTVRALSVPVNLEGQSLPTLTKSGERGGSGGSAHCIKEKPRRLANLTIFYGGVITAFSFSYIDQSGKRQHEGPWGKEHISQKSERIVFGPLEFVEEVSGAFGIFSKYTIVTSLTFVTNVRTYGPFGNPYNKDCTLTHFRFMADEGSSIVGFHGRSGTRLDSIGVYMYPNIKTTLKDLSLPVNLEGQTSMQILPTPIKSGQWGGSGGGAHDINEKPRRLTSLTVSYEGLIDAFSFSYIDQEGKKRSVGPWGEGYHWDTTSTIRFSPSEFVEEVSGAYGVHNGNIIVKFLTFISNIGMYGPFGTPDHPGPGVAATHFRFVAEKGSSIVGFYGRSGRYIDAIGFYTARVT